MGGKSSVGTCARHYSCPYLSCSWLSVEFQNGSAPRPRFVYSLCISLSDHYFNN